MVYGGALLWALDRMGVQGRSYGLRSQDSRPLEPSPFFAAWSVLQNLFCALLIFITRPFRIGDLVEVVESGEKEDVKGRVIDIDLVYTTLLESGDARSGTSLQLLDSLLFQRIVRRWHGGGPEAQ